jgi:hypothetical protein
VTAEITSADRERAKGKNSIGTRAYHWLKSTLPMCFNTVLDAPRRAAQAIRIRLPIPEGIRFWLALKRLQHEKSRVYDLYGKRHEEHRQSDADVEQIDQLNHDEVYELSRINEKIHQLYTCRIIAQAERHFLHVPEFQENSGDWEVARITGRWRLRREALVALLSAIRKKQRERREAAQANLIWVTAFTGMVGAVIGLTSVLSR